jgi:hypothetical protein
MFHWLLGSDTTDMKSLEQVILPKFQCWLTVGACQGDAGRPKLALQKSLEEKC